MVTFLFFIIFLGVSHLAALEDRTVQDHLKQSKPVPKHGPTLALSGCLQADWMHLNAHSRKEIKGSQQPHHRANHLNFGHFSPDELSVQVDLMLDYKDENSLGSFQIKFENPAGIQHHSREHCVRSNKNMLQGSGSGDNLYLVKAYMGYTLRKTDNSKLDFQLGRCYMSDLFDSKIEFNNEFDGINLHLTRFKANWGALDCTLGAFVIDDLTNHFGYVGQVDFLDIANSKCDLKYSLISWDKRGHNSCGKRHPLGNRFVNSQIVAIYHPHFIKHTQLYAAYLHNHAATPNWRTNHTKASDGAYGGFKIGDVKKKKDWSLDVNYQWVQAQAVPEWDVAGIGRFNPRGESFYSRPWGGFANYQGYIITFIYGITDALSLQLLFQQARPANRHIGGTFKASTFEITSIYNF